MNDSHKCIADLLNDHKYEIDNEDGFFICDSIEQELAEASSKVEQVVN